MNDGLFVYKHVCMLLVSLGHWCYQVEDEAMPVPPMLLITFVENAFKYGVSTFSHPSLSTHLMKHLSLHPRFRTGGADTILRAIEELTCKNTTFLIYRARMDCDSCSEEINGNFGSKKSVSFDTKLRRHEQRRRYLHF